MCAVVNNQLSGTPAAASPSAQPQQYPFPEIVETPSPRLGLAVMLADPYASGAGEPAPQTVPLPCSARVPPHAVGTSSVTWIKNGAPINLTRHPRYRLDLTPRPDPHTLPPPSISKVNSLQSGIAACSEYSLYSTSAVVARER